MRIGTEQLGLLAERDGNCVGLPLGRGQRRIQRILEGSFSLDLLNSIAQGDGQDLKAMAGPKGLGNIVVNHSNFELESEGAAKVIDGGGNQSAPPLFVDAESRNYHEAAGSPTIGTRIAGELGPLDLDGNPRASSAPPPTSEPLRPRTRRKSPRWRSCSH